MRIAVLGLGRMGAPMARNLAEIGHQVTLYNRTHARTLELGTAVGRVTSTVAAAVAEAQVALTMVTDDAAEEALAFDADGLLAHLPAGAIHLCMSTIGVDTSRRLAAAHEAKGQGYVAAPVFGRPGGAASRHLWIVAGGPEAQVTRCLGIFDALGRGLTRVGIVPELAHALKLGGNFLTATMVEGLAEVLAFGEKAGMAPADFLRLMNTAIFKSPLLDSYGGLMVRHTFDPADLSLQQSLNNTRAALRAFEALESPVPLAELLRQRLEDAESRGFGAQDLSVLFRACRIDAGLEVGSAAPRREEPSVDLSMSKAQGRSKKKTHPATIPAPEMSQAPVPEAPIPAPEPPKAVPEAKPAPEPAREPLPVVPQPVVESPQVFAPAAAPKVSPSREGTPVIEAAQAPLAAPAVTSAEPPLAVTEGPLATFHGLIRDQQVTLDLIRTTHFELVEGWVWAWHQGDRYKTSWRSLAEVEQAFRHVLFLRIQPHVLLQPETVLDVRPVFGGRSKAKVGEKLELDVSRAATPRLKELLGM